MLSTGRTIKDQIFIRLIFLHIFLYTFFNCLNNRDEQTLLYICIHIYFTIVFFSNDFHNIGIFVIAVLMLGSMYYNY